MFTFMFGKAKGEKEKERIGRKAERNLIHRKLKTFIQCPFTTYQGPAIRAAKYGTIPILQELTI